MTSQFMGYLDFISIFISCMKTVHYTDSAILSALQNVYLGGSLFIVRLFCASRFDWPSLPVGCSTPVTAQFGFFCGWAEQDLAGGGLKTGLLYWTFQFFMEGIKGLRKIPVKHTQLATWQIDRIIFVLKRILYHMGIMLLHSIGLILIRSLQITNTI